MPISLARRYRPKRFADLMVQDHVAAVLRGAVSRDRVGHGYLLTGPRGVGKTTAARILAMALNCPNRDVTGEPCGTCENCLRVWNGSADLDVVEIDAASNRGVDDARDLRERAMYAASREGHHKVYIVDEAHMLTREAWNALLKVLEEPPPGVVFVFATTEPQKIAASAAPVLSRLQRFDFRRIGPAAIRDRLRQVLDAEGIAADDDALTLIARHADGGMRDALSVLDQCLSFGEGTVTAERVRDVLGVVGDEIYVQVLRIVASRDAAGVFPLVDRLAEFGADLAEFIGGTGEALRSLLMVQLGAEPQGITEAMRRALDELRGQLQTGDLLRMLRMLAESETALRRSGNPRLEVESLLLRWCMLDRMVDLTQVLAGRAPPVPSATIPTRVSVPRPASSPQVAPPSAAVSPDNIPATLDALADAWPGIVREVRGRSRFLGEALGATLPTALDATWLTVTLEESNPLFAERLLAQAQAVEDVLREATGVVLRLRVSDASAGPNSAPGKPAKLSEASLKADRLRSLRAKDPALDTAADSLDLEIVD